MTSFVGRQAEVDQVRRELAASRLVTLIGPGGAGKTRLATRVAQDHADEFRFIALDSLRDPGLLAQIVAAELGLRDVPDEPTSRVVDFLRDKSLLLVLDNCEHMVQACGTLVGEILTAAPDVRILATSRHVLGVGGEQLLPVNPLPVPQVRNGRLVGDSSAVTLFADRASAAAPGFQMTADNQETVVKICQRLDGMPLAIELAVGWLRVLSLNELLTNIDDRFRLLSRGEQTKPERHQTLTATVDWSYELCSAEEQELWARLSVFDGGFTLAAAESVCDVDRFEILTRIADLVDKSVLIRASGHDSGQAVARYRMLDTIRQYGVRRLEQSGRLAEFRARHSRYFLDLGRTLASEWFGHRQLEMVALTRREHANIRSALESGLTHGDGLTGARLAVSLHFYWLNCGFFGEGRRWLDRVLKLDLPADLRVQALAVNAYATAGLGEGQSAVHMGQQAIGIARTLDDDELLWLALYCRATSALVTGDYPTAEKCYAEAIECYNRVPDPGARLFPPYAARGMTAAFCGNGQRALELGQMGIQYSAPRGEQWARAYAHYALAMAKWQLGDLDACLREAAESIQLHLRFNDLSGFVMVAEVLAAIAVGNQETERAAAILGVVERVWSEVGGSLLAGSEPWYVPHQACADHLRQVMGEERYTESFQVGTANGSSLAAAAAYVLSGRDRSGPLTKREQQVADLVAQGATNKEIAVRLNISRRTAEVHVDHILRKLQFASRAQIAAWVAARD
ncbi:ATP-binding protein [Kibdelosporangium phytohabitans]|uniref:ATP-binding protein n=1 Tax=Kibdelosporangium phytohabitans TaxID=860235 RepID=UPI0012FCADB6|nr:LuxR C-terminal-related transcriptional regulator [Kibdelosporangium phytohabitans]MBE1463203.1 non-specific serine/threonine protein kinase [Kibdelosporangium phytohabitans]